MKQLTCYNLVFGRNNTKKKSEATHKLCNYNAELQYEFILLVVFVPDDRYQFVDVAIHLFNK